MMFGDKRIMSRTVALLLLCASALVLTGCGSMGRFNPFAEKDKILPGDRRPAFPPGSGFEGPRKLPPPNSDYIGATMPANQVVAPAVVTPAPAPGTNAVPGAGVPAHQAATKKQPPAAPEALPPPPYAR
jgi:hypothetical protein